MMIGKPLFILVRYYRVLLPVTSSITYDRWQRSSIIGGERHLS